MDKPSAPSTLSLVLVPAILTLIVTVVRLFGEIQGWSPALFGGSNAPVGITWLVPIFGLWFGFRLRRATGGPKSLGKALGLVVLSVAVVAGGMWGLVQAELVVFPSKDNPVEPKGLVWGLAIFALGAIIVFIGWARLAGVLLLYGLLARIPVIAVTWFALDKEDWDTHYTKLPSGSPAKEGNELFIQLATPQITVWIVFTITVGVLFGCIGAAVAGRGPRQP